MKSLQRCAINTLGFLAIAMVVPNFHVENWLVAFVASIVLALVNMLVKPILSFLAFPITFLTFGLFSFIINALMILLTSSLVSGFHVQGLGTALLVTVLLTLFQRLAYSLVGYEDRMR